MTRWVRATFFWLTLLASPVLGVAAIDDVIRPVTDGPSILPIGHDGRDAFMPARSPPPVERARQDHGESAGDSAEPPDRACDGGQACVPASAPPSSSIRLPPSMVGAAPAPLASALAVAFLTDGPDRPPRSSLA